ncbi:hypothetical protein SAMN02745121_09256 [Nannocystis exedens]|uniref:Lipoprotein n=1 Tax=Nannocystis exedens TaxID=54 RepID=A0A1I2JAC8_9BACT|nr:hypothetical protein [Nannocystis exedens]PCC74688.1 hypothetical protein NAEX_07785 [Nannocystis exedens]SFF51474.1 hypothetical protein SAMN02745121_09256 [Nannocystis exedens]
MPASRILALFLLASSACSHVANYGPVPGDDVADTDEQASTAAGDSDRVDSDAAAPAAAELASPPAHARLEAACAPGGGKAVRIRIGLAAPRCDADPTATELLVFVFQGGPLAPGTYELDDGGGYAFLQSAGPAGARSGRVTITAWDEQAVTGTYALKLPDGGVLSGGFAGPACPGEAACG